jgi:hypothetical protein
MEKEKEEVMIASDLIKGMRDLLKQYNRTNKVGIERVDVECVPTKTLSGNDYIYNFHITFE